MGNTVEQEDYVFDVLDELLSRAIWLEGSVAFIRNLSKDTRSKRTFYDTRGFRSGLAEVCKDAFDAQFAGDFEPAGVITNILEEYSTDLRRARLEQPHKG
jgi:hypothetical protein